MIAEITERLTTLPFQPFTIVTSSGQKYRVQSRDHAHISPTGKCVLVFLDNDASIVISGLHIVATEQERPSSTALP